METKAEAKIVEVEMDWVVVVTPIVVVETRETMEIGTDSGTITPMDEVKAIDADKEGDAESLVVETQGVVSFLLRTVQTIFHLL